MRNHHLREDESPLVGIDHAASKSDGDQKRHKSIWWCCFGDASEGGSSCAFRTASWLFQRMRRSNHWDEEGSMSDAWWLHRGWKNSVRRTIEWCESRIECAQNAAGSSKCRWKSFVGKLGTDIEGMRSKLWHSKQPRFQYDALSYALNFDEGIISRFELEHGCEPFVCRFAVPLTVPVEIEGRL